MNYQFTTAIILAGGKSRRMGVDKQGLAIDNKRILYQVANKLSSLFNQIIIVTNKYELYKDFKGELVSDIYPNKGPLGGIHAGLLSTRGDYAFVIPCDMPNISLELIKYQINVLSQRSYDAMVNLSYDNKLDPFPGFYSRNLIQDIEKCLEYNQLSISNLIDQKKVYYLGYKEIDRYIDPRLLFINLNTPLDLARYLDGLENGYEKLTLNCH